MFKTPTRRTVIASAAVLVLAGSVFAQPYEKKEEGVSAAEILLGS